jgi:hypothetical protein
MNAEMNEEINICKGCNCDIDDNGKCGKECRFADYCGVWWCEECRHKNTDTETCFKCGYLNEMNDNEEEGSTTNDCECCGEFNDVGLATGENGIEMLVCKHCDTDGSNYNGWGDETEYMNELIECFKCEKDVKRKNMAWGMGGGYYLDVCQACYDENQTYKICDDLYNNFVIQEWDDKDDGTDGFSYIHNDDNEEDQMNNEINLNYENFNAKRSCMWVEEIKRRSKWVRGETIYGFNREKYCTYQICWSRDKTKIGFYNWILEADGYVSFLLCNGYTTDETANTKFMNYIRPSCLYNDKNSAIL